MLDEPAHGRDAGTRGDQDERGGGVGGEAEAAGGFADGAVDRGVGVELGEMVGCDAVVHAVWVAECGGAQDVVGEGCCAGAEAGEGGGGDGVGAGEERGEHG